MKRILEDLLSFSEVIVRFLSAILLIGIGIAKPFGLLDSVAWLNENLISILITGVGLILGLTAIDRYTKLSRIEKLIKETNASIVGSQHLETTARVIDGLKDMVSKSNEFVYALGAKSHARSYLDKIGNKVKLGEIEYIRLLTGDHITHRLHEHLDNLLTSPRVTVAWNRSEKYGHLSVSELGAIWGLPTPYKNEFSGLWLPGERNARLYSHYFLQAMADEETIAIRTTKSIEYLCEDCSPNTARNEDEIKRVLLIELEPHDNPSAN